MNRRIKVCLGAAVAISATRRAHDTLVTSEFPRPTPFSQCSERASATRPHLVMGQPKTLGRGDYRIHLPALRRPALGVMETPCRKVPEISPLNLFRGAELSSIRRRHAGTFYR